MDNNWFKELFINEAKPALDRCGDTDTFVGESFETLTLSNDSTAPAQFSELVGLKVVEKMSGRRLLAASVERFEGEPETRLYRHRLSSNTGESISYGTVNGMLDTPCLTIDSAAIKMRCPSYFYDKPNAMLVYAFEEAHDTIGLGVTIPPGGWYAADGTTFTVEPFDQERHPFFITTDELTAYAEDGTTDYLYSMFPLAEEFAYTVSESNIFEYSGVICSCPMKVDHIEFVGDDVDDVAYLVGGLHYLGSFSIRDGDVGVGINPSFNRMGDKTVSITYPVIKQLDPKFIPDGTPNIKKASIGDTIIVKAVDENGVPTAWESAIMHEKTLTAAKEYTDSQRLAHTETKTITWDRDTDGREVIMIEENAENNVYYRIVKVSDTPVELTRDSVKHMEMTYVRFKGTQNEQTAQSSVDLNEVAIGRIGVIDVVAFNDSEGLYGVLSLTQDYTETDDEGNEHVVFSRGVWFMEHSPGDLTYYITSLTVEEIHRIDPKFLPAGGGIPTVVLETEINPDENYNPVMLSESDLAAVVAACEKNHLVALTRTNTFSGNTVTSILQRNDISSISGMGFAFTGIYVDACTLPNGQQIQTIRFSELICVPSENECVMMDCPANLLFNAADGATSEVTAGE